MIQSLDHNNGRDSARFIEILAQKSLCTKKKLFFPYTSNFWNFNFKNFDLYVLSVKF